MAEVALLTMATILTLGVIAFGSLKRAGFNMLDAYFLMTMLFFGVYSMVDALVNKAAGKDPAIVVVTFVLIFLAMLVTWMLYQMLSSRVRIALRFDSLMEQWAVVPRRTIVYLATIFFALHTYLFLAYGMLTYAGAEIERLDISVPTWIGPLRALVNAIGFGLYVCIGTSIAKRRIGAFSLFGALALAIAAVLTLEGRRAFIELVIFAFVLWSCSRRENVYSVRHVPIALVMLVGFFLLSNIYQTYREEVISIQARMDHREVSGLISAAGNIDATIDNYRQRLAMWNFNYMITAEQIKSPTKILSGAMLWQTLLNSLPAALFESKQVVDPDDIIAQFYGFPVTGLPDYPTNDLATYLADFGVAMLVLLPVINILVFLIVSYSHFSISKIGNTLFLLVSTLCLQYLIKVENSYGDIFILLRNILLLLVLWFAAELWRRVYRGALGTNPT